MPTSATRSSHSDLRSGSIASDFTVLIPKIVSPSTEARSVSAAETSTNTFRSGRSEAKMTSMITPEIVERQPEQAIEQMQIQLGIHLGADREHDQAPRMAEKCLVDDGDAEN